jgi:hypothetical protein
MGTSVGSGAGGLGAEAAGEPGHHAVVADLIAGGAGGGGDQGAGSAVSLELGAEAQEGGDGDALEIGGPSEVVADRVGGARGGERRGVAFGAAALAEGNDPRV